MRDPHPPHKLESGNSSRLRALLHASRRACMLEVAQAVVMLRRTVKVRECWKEEVC